MSSLHSTTVFSLFDFSSKKAFFFTQAIIHLIDHLFYIASDHNTVTFSNQNSLHNLFFFLIPIKKKVWVISSHSRFLFNKYLHLYKYLFWLIPSKDPGNAK